MTRAIWTPLAESELEDILLYIRIEGGRPETSRRIGEEIRDSADEQATGRRPGQIHPAAPKGWPYFQCKRWSIFYQRHVVGIEIMRVVNAVRDIPNILGNPPEND